VGDSDQEDADHDTSATEQETVKVRSPLNRETVVLEPGLYGTYMEEPTASTHNLVDLTAISEEEPAEEYMEQESAEENLEEEEQIFPHIEKAAKITKQSTVHSPNITNTRISCPVEDCGCTYKDKRSINRHLRTKHPELADAYIDATKATNKNIATGNINNYLKVLKQLLQPGAVADNLLVNPGDVRLLLEDVRTLAEDEFEAEDLAKVIPKTELESLDAERYVEHYT
jgi:hypothetical protein